MMAQVKVDCSKRSLERPSDVLGEGEVRWRGRGEVWDDQVVLLTASPVFFHSKSSAYVLEVEVDRVDLEAAAGRVLLLLLLVVIICSATKYL